MKITIITQVYLPEMGALANRLYPFVKKLAAAGHEVNVATGMPNYPAGEVFKDYRGKFSMTEEREGCRIFRTNYYTVPRNKSKLSQVISYLSFMPAVFWSGWRAGKADVVFITSPPIFPLIPAVVLAKLRGAKLVFDLRDLWSDELITYGRMSENSIHVRISKMIENWGYRVADLITGATKSIIKTVCEKGATLDKTAYLPNGADLELFRPLAAENPIADSYNFGDRFVVMYAGLFGLKHELETFVKAAELLQERKDILFFLIGNGATKETLVEFVREKSLDNVVIADERSVEDIPYVLARADICYAAYKTADYPKKLISVKLFEYMACEKPYIGGFTGESERVTEESGGGVIIEKENPAALVEAILELQKSSELRENMGKAGRRYVEQNFSRMEWAEEFERMLTKLVEKPQTNKSAGKIKESNISV